MAKKKTTPKQATPEEVGAAMYNVVKAFNTIGERLADGYNEAVRLGELKEHLKNEFNLDFEDEQLRAVDAFMKASQEKTMDFLQSIAEQKSPIDIINEMLEECDCDNCKASREEDNSEIVEHTLEGDDLNPYKHMGIGKQSDFGVSKDEYVELPAFTLSTANGDDEDIVEHKMSKLETAMQAFKIILAIAIVVLLTAIYLKL